MPNMDDRRRLQAEWLAFDALLAVCARDLQNCTVIDHIVMHDLPLCKLWSECRATRMARFDFPHSHVEVYCPVAHVSASSRHRFAPSCRWRDAEGGELRDLGLSGLTELVIAHLGHAHGFSRELAQRTRVRVRESADNLAVILGARRGRRAELDFGLPTFLASEQALLAGHTCHPFAKSRLGFSRDELLRYSPELCSAFRLYYMLVHKSLAVVDHVGESPFKAMRDDLLVRPLTSEQRTCLEAHPDFLVLPLHPWEAARLLRLDPVQQALSDGRIYRIGTAGRPFFATSSVRTVYAPGFPFMVKLSLHVAITNCERVNHLHELRKGCEVARLLASPWGDRLRADVPQLRLLADTGFAAVRVGETWVDGFNTSFRENPFTPEAPVVVVAALCEPPLEGHAPLTALLHRVAAQTHRSPPAAAIAWFERYCDTLLGAALGAYAGHGLALEMHQQNALVELDESGMPVRIFFRDNQGFFFREKLASYALREVPGLRDVPPCILTEEQIYTPLAYYILVNNLLGMIDALASQSLSEERTLLTILRDALLRAHATDTTGFVERALCDRTWPTKANLTMVVQAGDEATRPLERSATFGEIDNPLLPLGAMVLDLVQPSTQSLSYTRVFERCDLHFEVRPFAPQHDLSLLYDWVNQDYARDSYQLAGPIAGLEAYCNTLLSAPYTHAFMALANGVPAFWLETFWAMRDVLGRYYPARPGDHGFHILLGPPTCPISGFSQRALQVTVELFLRNPGVERIVVEPDHRNGKILRRLEGVGFQHAGTIDLPDKRAALMFCTRESFVARCPESRAIVMRVERGRDWPPAALRPEVVA